MYAGKRRKSVRRCANSKICGIVATKVSNCSAHNADVGWFVWSTTVWDGRKEWTVGLNQDSIDRAQFGCFAKFNGILEGNDAAETEIRTAVETRTSFIGSAGEAMNDGVRRHSFCIKHVESVFPCITSVNHQCEVVFFRQRNLLCKGWHLNIAWRMFVVVIKTTFANADNPWLINERNNGSDALCCIVWV
jgi:hypothetical protein